MFYSFNTLFFAGKNTKNTGCRKKVSQYFLRSLRSVKQPIAFKVSEGKMPFGTKVMAPERKKPRAFYDPVLKLLKNIFFAKNGTGNEQQ